MKGLKDKIIEDFTNYYNNFNVEDNNIKRKYYHSLKVMKFSKEIAYSENLNENDIEISIVSGLLHDYARFIQWTEYHTYTIMSIFLEEQLMLKNKNFQMLHIYQI